MGNLSKKNEILLNFILEVEIFDVWGIDFMGPFSIFEGQQVLPIHGRLCLQVGGDRIQHY